jgi:hypothetical protein
MNTLRWALLGIGAVASLAAGFMTAGEDAHQGWWSVIPGFFALFGFAGCLVIIVFSKFLGKHLLYKREDYYNGD